MGNAPRHRAGLPIYRRSRRASFTKMVGSMFQETIRFLIVAFIYALCLFGAAFLLTGCEGAGRIAAYCLQDPRNCD